jgi:hypothetical protein
MCTYLVKNNQLDTTTGTIKKEFGLNIPMGLEMGGSFIGGNFYSSLSCSYSLVYQIREGVYLLPGLSATLLTDTKWITGNQLKSGSFLDVFINLKAPNSSLFYGTDTKLYFGYLFQPKGYLFPKNTWRFGIEVPVGKSLRLDFSNYFSGHDNSACHGIGFKYIFF